MILKTCPFFRKIQKKQAMKLLPCFAWEPDSSLNSSIGTLLKNHHNVRICMFVLFEMQDKPNAIQLEAMPCFHFILLSEISGWPAYASTSFTISHAYVPCLALPQSNLLMVLSLSSHMELNSVMHSPMLTTLLNRQKRNDFHLGSNPFNINDPIYGGFFIRFESYGKILYLTLWNKLRLLEWCEISFEWLPKTRDFGEPNLMGFFFLSLISPHFYCVFFYGLSIRGYPCILVFRSPPFYTLFPIKAQ